MKIDVHSHIFDQRYFDAMWRDFELERSTTPQGQTLMRKNGYTYMWYRDNFFDVEHRLRVMDQQGIDMRVLSLSSPNVYDWQGAQITLICFDELTVYASGKTRRSFSTTSR